MNISRRMALTIALAMALGLVGTFGVAGTVIIDQFKEAEADQVATSMAAVAAQLENDRTLLASSANAFGQVVASIGTGANASANATDPAEQAGQMALGRALFDAHGVDDLFFVMPPLLAQIMLANATQQPGAEAFDFDPESGVFGMSLDAAGNFTPADPELTGAIPALHFGDLAPLEQDSDLVAVAGKVWLVGAVGLSLADLGVASGMGAESLLGAPTGLALVVARQLDDGFLATLGQETGRQLALEDVGVAGVWAPNEVRLDRPTWGHLTARIPITDSEQRPVAVLASPQDRVMFEDAIQAMTYFFVATLAIAVLVLVAAMVVARRTVGRPIRHLGEQMAVVRDSGDLKMRVAKSNGRRRSVDEVDHLAQQFDSLLATLEEKTAELEQSNHDLQQFANVVSHDLKSPLSTLSLNLALLHIQAKRDGNAEEIKALAKMKKGIATMDERITGILAYSRARKPEIQLDPVDLDPLLQEVRNDLAADIKRTDAKVAVEKLPTVLGDRIQLAQVFQNLLANALKFAKPGEAPAVRIWAVPGQTGWAVHVEDHGRGFDPADLTRLFKPFSRLDNSDGVEGQGIGLATCARIMQRLGGRLNAEGVPGKGAKFTVLLKATPEPATA